MWNKITIGLSGEETTNFNLTRTIADSVSQLYEARTVAAIENSDLEYLNDQVRLGLHPNVIGQCQPERDRLLVAIDNSLIVFDVSCNETVLNVDFSHRIQHFVTEGDLVFVLLRNASIICVHALLGASYRLERILPELENGEEIVSVHITGGKNEMDLTIVSDKRLLRISEIDVKYLEDNFREKEAQLAFESYRCIIRKFSSYFKASCATYSKSNGFYYIIGKFERMDSGESRLLWLVYTSGLDQFDQFSLPDEINSVCKLEILQELGLVLLLTDTSELFLLCRFTLIVLGKIKESRIQNAATFCILESSLDPCIVLLSGGDHQNLISLTVPCFERRFKLNVSPASYLVLNQHDDHDHGMFFIEECHVEASKILRVKVLEEVQPEYRLERLLRKGKLIEAEKFALAFQLNMELVHKANISRMIESLQPWTKAEPALLEDVLQIMDRIKDVAFIAKICWSAILPDIKSTRKLLNYGISRVASSKSKGNVELLEASGDELHEMLKRLDTYVYLHGHKLLQQMNPLCFADDWLKFSLSELHVLVLSHLKKGEMKEASIIWNRHSGQLENCFHSGVNMAMTLFNSIPNWVPASSLLIWLRESVPSIVDISEAVHHFTKWILDKLKSMEVLDKSRWPDDAIQVCKQVIEILEGCHKRNIVLTSPSDTPFSCIVKFIKVLNSLSQLKHVHSILISYDDFVNSDFKAVVFQLLDRVACSQERIDDLVNRFIYPRLLELKLSSEDILYFYVKKLIEVSPAWSIKQDSAWEIRISAVLNCIHSDEKFLEGVLCVVKKASIPWSNIIKRLVEKALTYDHPLTSNIGHEYYSMPQKLIIKKYGFTDLRVSDNQKMERMIQHIMYVSKEEALEDALQYVTGTDLRDFVYSIFIYKYVVNGKWTPEKVDSVIEGLPKHLIDKIWDRVAVKLHFLNGDEFFKSKLDLFIPFKKYIEDAGHLAQPLFASCNLQRKFGISASATDLSKCSRHRLKEIVTKISQELYKKGDVSDNCEPVIEDCDASTNLKKIDITDTFTIKWSVSNQTDPFTDVTSIFSLVKQVAPLLNLPLENALLISAETLFQFCSSKEKYLFLQDCMTNMLSAGKMTVFDNEMCEDLRRVAVHLISKLFSDSQSCSLSSYDLKSFEIIYSLVSHCLLLTSSKCAINIGLELSKWLNLLSGAQFKCIQPLKQTIQYQNIRAVSQFITRFLNEYICYAYITRSNNGGLCSTFEGCFSTVGHLKNRLFSSTEFEVELRDLLTHLLKSEFKGPEVVNLLFTVYYSFIAVTGYSCRTDGCYENQSNSLSHLWLSSPNDAEFWKNVIHYCIGTILDNLTSRQRFNLNYALALLDYFSPEIGSELLAEMVTNYSGDKQRLNCTSLLGMQYCELREVPHLWHEFSRQNTLCMWSRHLSKLGINIKDPFSEDKEIALEQLIRCIPTKANITMLRDFCVDGKLDFQESLLSYVQHLLLSWQPIIVIESDNSGKNVMTVTNDAEELSRHVKFALSIAEDVNELLQYCVNKIWPMINSYYYETYLVVLDLIDYVNGRISSSCHRSTEKNSVKKEVVSDSNVLRLRSLLSFLNIYKRISVPSKEEQENNISYKSMRAASANNLSRIAEFRLPFTGLLEEDATTMIKPELSLSTYEVWLKIASLLKLNTDEICFLAIHRSFQNEMKPPVVNGSKTEWIIHRSSEKLLNVAEQCISHIANIEIVCASYFYVLKNLPPGSDQVRAAELCYLSASKWYEVDKSEKTHSNLVKIHKKYTTVSTLDILYRYELAQPEHIQFTMNPEELITVLYNHPSILNRTSAATAFLHNQKFPDINSAVEEISILHKKDIKPLKWKLVNEWLMPDPSSQLDVTFSNRSVGGFNDFDLDCDHDFHNNIERACYVLSREDPNISCSYLADIVFTGAGKLISRKVDYSARLRVLICLQKIATPDFVMEVTGRNESDIRQLTENLWFLSQLEKYGIQSTLDSFKGCCKKDLVKQLLENLSASVIDLIVKLCITYQIHDSLFWNPLVTYMVHNKMVQQLEEILPTLQNISCKLDPDIYLSTWNLIITSMFSQLGESNQEVSSTIKKCLRLIQKCPCPGSLDLNMFLLYCQKFNYDSSELDILKTFLNL